MKKLLLITAITAFTATLSSCKEEHHTGSDPVEFYKIINESGHKLTIVNNSDPIRESTFEEPVVLENDEFIEWEHLRYGLGKPITVFYEEGDRLECYFDDEYKIVFMADKYHEYNFASIATYSEEQINDDSRKYTYFFTEEMYDYAVELNEQCLIFAGSEEPGFVLPPQYQDEEGNEGDGGNEDGNEDEEENGEENGEDTQE